MRVVIVTGTDTDVGKTVFAAALTRALDGCYWKPVQSGIRDGTDRQAIRDLSGLPDDRLLPEAYVLSEPLSPHRSAELDGIAIDVDALTLPADLPAGRPLIIEGAGGVMVPLSRNALLIDLLARWRAPVVVCARTRLGTINHSLLTVEALRTRHIPILGIAFIGDPVPDSEQTICAFAGVQRLGRLPHLSPLTAAALADAFAGNFRTNDFLGGDG